VADLAQKRPATSETVYHLFSATKLYTATAIMQLIEAGKLILDTGFTQILPEYRSKTLDPITVRHLLSHTSGLNDTTPALLAAHPGGQQGPTTADVLKHYLLKPKHGPGRKVEYRNVNFMILGRIIEILSGESYVDYVTEHILRPLGMPAAFSYTPEMLANSATGYQDRNDLTLLLVRLAMPGLRWVIGERSGRWVAIRPYEIDSLPIGGLLGPAAAFAPFLIAHLNDGQGILKASSALQMRSLIASGQAGFEAKLGMGLGWKIGEIDGRRFYNHEGSGAGFATETRIYPDENLGILLMMNVSGIRFHHLQHHICETIRAKVHSEEE
jgi:D-alanyl-D-alanine carboxypeptidase